MRAIALGAGQHDPAPQRPTLPLVDSGYVLDATKAMLGQQSAHFKPLSEFVAAATSGTLPPVSWIDPNYVDLGPGGAAECEPTPTFPRTANDDHPPTDIAHAQALVATLLFALMNSPQWEKTLFVITYDEHGGFYDHVTPREVRLPDPDATLGQFPADEIQGNFGNLGVRVPALVVSPWVEAGQVSSDVFDHTSIIKTIMQRFCDPPQVAELGPRVQAARHLGYLLKASAPRFMDRSLIGAPTGRGSLPTTLRNDLLSKLGQRMSTALGRPRAPHPPYELEQQIVEARHYLRQEAQRGTIAAAAS